VTAVTDVFLSYKAEDRSRIVPLVQALEQDGYTVWWDQHIGGGDDWRSTILRQLESARCVMVVWSRRSVGPEGEFVRDEAVRAKKLGTYLPVRIDKVDPPLGFGETQALNLLKWKGNRADANYQALLAVITSRSGEPRTGRSATRPSVDRRALLAGGAVLVAAAGVGAWKFLLPTAKDDGSVAVLPFANLSGDAAQAYFSDGIAEELRATLSRIPRLRVVARTSSEAVRNLDAKAAAAKLHVRNILTGSVRRSPEAIRISAQLIDGSNGTERWSENYDRPFGDTLRIQTEIATMVAQSLSLHLEGWERRALEVGGTQNADAQDLLLQAQGLSWRNDDEASLRRALEFVDRALALDSRYADAIATKSSIVNALSSFFATSAEDKRIKSEAANKLAREAIAIAPKLSSAHSALANNLWTALRLRQGLAEFDKAARLPGGNVSFFGGFDSYALALTCCRQFDAALAYCEQRIANDPLNPNAFNTKGVVLVHARRYAEAYETLSQAIALGPDLRWPRAFQAMCLMETGRENEARAIFDSIEGFGPWLSMAATLAHRQSRDADAQRYLVLMQREMGDAGYFQYAEVFAQQGRIDEAIRALEHAWRARDAGLPFANVDALLDPLRKDRRFQEIIRRLDFPT
jgi:TolB-like protein/Tfp pilus assembly protein PilF